MNPSAIAAAAWLLIGHGAVQAAEYCAVAPNTCVARSGGVERGRTGTGLHFVLRADGSGCIGHFGHTLDCQANVFSNIHDRTPWLVACYIEGDSRVCSASDGSAAKMRVHEHQGWSLGIGHNNYPGAPVRVEVNKRTREVAVNDGWLPAASFAEVFRLMTKSSKTLFVDWVEEERVDWGPKWHPSSVDGRLVQAVFDYIGWAVRHKDLQPLPSRSSVSQTPEKPDLGPIDCYSLRLGASLDEALKYLGRASEVNDDFVNSAGVRGVTVRWHTDETLCSARFAPLLTRYSVTDNRTLKSK